MIKQIIALLMTLSLLACQNSVPEIPMVDHLSILSPRGAPAFALIPLINDGKDQIDFVDGVDVLSAELIKGDYDVIVAPVNLGAQLSEKGDNPYRLLAILTWGNLYIIENLDIEDQSQLALFGLQAVPGKVFTSIENLLDKTYQAQAFASVSEVSAQMLAEQFKYGLLAEPALSATLLQAKQANVNFSIRYDLQALWQKKTGHDNYPQAGLFVKADLDLELITLTLNRIEAMQDFMSLINVDLENLDTALREVELVELGLPSIVVLKEAFGRMNIRPLLAEEEFESIEAFLQVFNLSQQNGFYYFHDLLD